MCNLYLYKIHNFSKNFWILKQVPNSAIKDCTNVTDMSGKEFLNPAFDKTVKVA